jgi:putative DNA primase/helicase
MIGTLSSQAAAARQTRRATVAEFDRWLDGVEPIILDKLSSLTAGLRENDSDAWSPIQEWLLRLRRRGISVLIVHHAGKRGEQRGSADKFTQSAQA